MNRKTILSAISVMASLSMFAASPSDGKGKTQTESEATPIVQTSDKSAKQAENQAIVRDVMREFAPVARQKNMQREKERNEKWQEEMIRQAKEREAEEKERLAREKEEREEFEKHASKDGCRKCKLEAKASRLETEEWIETSMALRKELAAKNEEIRQLKMENEKCRRNLNTLQKVGVFGMAMLGAIIGHLCQRRRKVNCPSPSVER